MPNLSWLGPRVLVGEVDGVDDVRKLGEHGDQLRVQHSRGYLRHLRYCHVVLM